MTVQPKYQTFVKRFIAGILDGLVFFPFGFMDEYINTINNAAVVISWAFIYATARIMYVVIGHGKYGHTLGKRAMGIKVLDLDEKNIIGYKRAFLRESVWILAEIAALIWLSFTHTTSSIIIPGYDDTSTFIATLDFVIVFWFVAELVTMMFNKKRRAVHDFMAGSVVVDTDELKREAAMAGQYQP
jgi:uncharacterized RDD family membrane protein YckC